MLILGFRGPKFTPSATRRVAQIFEKPQFNVDGARCNDVIQGKTVITICGFVFTDTLFRKLGRLLVFERYDHYCN